MRIFSSRKIVLFLLFILVFQIMISGSFGIHEVRAAGFWEDNKDNVFTVVKGLLMLWIINLMRNNIGGNEDEDLLTSTIKNSLNIGDTNTQTDQNSGNSEEQVIDVNDREKYNNIINNEYVSDEEFEMLKLVNQVRQEQGLNLLELDMGLAKIAREKAVDMITNNYFDHDSPTHGTPFDMIKEKGVEYSLAGENLADSNSIEDAFNSLMNSEDHKENILKDRYDKVGIGVVEKDDGGFMIVQLFIDKPVPVK